MKVFVVGPETDDYFTHNVAYTFRTLGYEVFSEPQRFLLTTKSVIGRGLDQIFTKYSRIWCMRRDRWAVKVAREIKPQLTVVCTRNLEPETIRIIKKVSGGMVVCWYGDSAANLKRNHIVSGEYDAVFMKDLEFVEQARSMLGIKVFHLDEACNPAWHRPVAERSGDKILVSGSLYGYRNAFLSRLHDTDFRIEIYGPSPPLWASKKVTALHTGMYLDHTNKARAFGEAMACLNTFSPAERNNLNCRIFETCGCGGLLLSERRNVISRCFEPGKEFLDFDSFDDCLEQLDRLRRDYSFAVNVRKFAVKRAHGEHTYRHRLIKMLQILEIL